ncbi:hypothetical protein [Pseudogemmobacter faecipullorum]|uniref:Bacterial toxin 44 domain-containing protein n=1 Tax=Pseudogemmobacter faecipullorum TaxID=2755041 RepID=A0ABS8CLN0_9RHOB|nr:hypothetical protein [Pseudogemmobacter faecipullorum]MCB5410302.1 hypothetical protein [Pseudogemmobacter faecipullorum]
MVDLAGAGAIISGLGGLFGKKQKLYKMDGQIWDAARGARLASEDFGFNPLTLLNTPTNGGTAYGGGPSMGESIGNAMMLLADNLGGKDKGMDPAAQQVTRLANQNAELKRKLDSQTIRPKVGGIYAQTEAVPSLASALGKSNGQPASGSVSRVNASRGSGAVSADPSGLTPLPTSEATDPRRKVEDSPVKTHSGFMVIDNPYFGRLRVPTLDGDEALQWYDYPSLAGIYAGNKAWDIGTSVGTYGRNKFISNFGLSPHDWWNGKKYDVNPDGYNEQGKPFWRVPGGTTWNPPKKHRKNQ